MKKFAIDEGSIIKDNKLCWLRVVTSISVNEVGVTEVFSSEFWFDKKGDIRYDHETFADTTVEDIYRHYTLVGEDYKLFEKE